MKRTHSSDVGQRSFKYPGICVEPASLLHGEPNRVSTTRFTPLTWLPKSLFLQFQRAANIYFLFIAVIVCMPFSPKRWQSKVFPYILVLAWTALKDLYEDSRRKMDDHVENSRMCWRFSMEHGFEQIAWRRVKPGDFVCTMCDEAFPADLLVVCAAGGYSAFISTVNLDGETNLKLRRPPNLFCSLEVDLSSTARPTVPPTVASHVVSQACRQQLHIHLASPCADLTEFNASLSLDAPDVQSDVQGSHSASCDSFVPRGCVLRNTDWLLSIVAYAGKDTKQCLNSAQVSGKVSNMQSLLNRCVYGLLTGLFFTCCYMATAAKIIDSNTEWPIRFLAYAITLYHVVPISLYVAFEVLKLMLGRFIDKDPQLFGAAARTADLVEELGQIDFIFSDKTGTLTSNDMRFARCAVGDKVFDSFLQDSLGGPVPGVEQVTSIFNEGPTGSGELGSKLRWFFTCLAVCNTVEVNEKTQYSGPSPDEVALVQGAHLVGISLKERVKASKLKKEEHVVVSTPEVEDRVFSILHTIEFSADRKRMSVICRHEGAIYCITKGADSIMSPLLIAELGQEEEEQLRRFSQMGLRTLVVASKQVDPSTFASWEADWLSAKTLLEGRTEKLAECGATIEKDLQLSGISAVEDRLQEGVPDAIADLKQAGIRFWVLTGDKTETAVDIAHSCNLFSKDTGLAFLTGATDALGAQTCLALAQKHLEHGKCGSIDKHVDNGLVIDGQTLQWILEGHAEDELYKLGMLSIGCVCSRLSPAQKRRLVDVVRKHSNSITLAIGDGANDVPMILGAHAGIGLRGKEGSQAVQASDIAISQFRFIVPLLMCHGRRAYRRVATFLCYYFYKNVALAMGDLIWAHQNSFSGEVAYPEWLSTSFNAVFTWWPVIFVLAFDEDVSDVMSNTNPKIYIEGVERKWFNLQVFGWWMISAAFHGSLSWLLPMLCFGSSDYDAVTFWRASSTSFTMVIFVVALKLALHDFKRLSISCLLPVAGSVASYVIVLLLLGYLPLGQKMQPNLSDGGELPVPGWIFSNVVPLILITLGPMAALIPDILILWWGRKWHPSPLFEVRHGIHQACL